MAAYVTDEMAMKSPTNIKRLKRKGQRRIITGGPDPPLCSADPVPDQLDQLSGQTDQDCLLRAHVPAVGRR